MGSSPKKPSSASAEETAAKKYLQEVLRTPLLGNVQTETLLEMLKDAQPWKRDPGEELERPDDCIYVLVEGSLELVRDNASTSSLQAQRSSSQITTDRIPLVAPASLGPLRLPSGTAYPGYTLKAGTQGAILLHFKSQFWELFERDPDFQRAVLRRHFNVKQKTVGALMGSEPFGRKAKPSSPTPILVLRNGTPTPLPTAGLAALVSFHIAKQFNDHVRVLHLSSEVSDVSPTWTRVFDTQKGTVRGWVEHAWLRAPSKPAEFEDAILAATKLASETRISDEVSLFIVEVGDAKFTPKSGELDIIYLCDKSICDEDGLPSELVKAQHDIGHRFFDILYTGLLPSTHDAMTECERTWPLGTVRLRLPREFMETLRQKSSSQPELQKLYKHVSSGPPIPELQKVEDHFERWARAVTARRVGLALGGGGAYGYVHIALIQKLSDKDKRVPVDLVSGSSFGSIVGAFYASRGLGGVGELVQKWLLPTSALTLGLISTWPMGKLLERSTGRMRLDALEMPMFPVVVDADSGNEWDLREAPIGEGIRASCALPPIAPTMEEDRTYLDGGLVANVPVYVLQDEGAGMVIASNCLTNPLIRDRRDGLEWLKLARETLSPRRLHDFLRMFFLMMRVAGNNQAQSADVVYEPPREDIFSLATFWKGSQMVSEAMESAALASAVNHAIQLWASYKRHAAGAVLLTDDCTLEVRPPLMFKQGATTLTASTEGAELPRALRDFLRDNIALAFTVSVKLEEPEKEPDRAKALHLAHARARALRSQIRDTGIPFVQIELAWHMNGADVIFKDVRWLSSELRKNLEDMNRAVREIERSLDDHAAREAWSRAVELIGALKRHAAKRYASTLEPSLRRLLEFQGAPVAVPEANVGTQAFFLAWCGDDRLAIGGEKGVQLWRGIGTEKVESIRYGDKAVAGLDWHPSGRLACSLFHSVLVFTPGPDGWGLPQQLDPMGWEKWGICFSPDGGRLLTSHEGRNLVRLSAERLSSKTQVTLHTERVKRAVWSPTGRFVAALSEGGEVLVWETDSDTGTPRKLETHAQCLEWHPLDDRLAIGCGSRLVLFHFDEKKEPTRMELGEQPGVLAELAWSREDGDVLAALAIDVRLWDVGTGKLRMVLKPSDGPQTGMAWHPGGKFLATWSDHVTVWDLRREEPIARYGGTGAKISMAAWSETGQYIAMCCYSGKVHVWKPAMSWLFRHMTESGQPLRGAYWHPTLAHCAASGSADGSVQLWDPLDPETVYPSLSEPSKEGLELIAWSPRGTYLVTLDSRRLRLWTLAGPNGKTDPHQPRLHKSLEVPSSQGGRLSPELCWSPDERWLVIHHGRGKVSLCDVGSGELRPGPSLFDDADITSAAWHPRKQQVVLTVFKSREQLVIWDVEQRHEPSTVSITHDGLWDVAFSPDGSHLAVAANAQQAVILDTESWKEQAALKHKRTLRKVAWSPCGNLLATQTHPHNVDVWDAKKGELLTSPWSTQPRGGVTALTWRCGGQTPLLVVTSLLGEVLAWGEGPWGWDQVASLDKPRGFAVHGASFSPDGKRVITGDKWGTASVLPVDDELLHAQVEKMSWEKALRPLAPSQLTKEEDKEKAA
jgi:WD40 repeat protein/predicted acylesterase/phospholipase RssA